MTLNREVVGFIDIGTNSIRMMVASINPNSSYNILREEKEVVRLGENEFKHDRLQPEAMQRALEVCKRFPQLARTLGAKEIVAVATSATREAKNQEEFLRLLREEAGLDVMVVSGKEEARLIFLGMTSGVSLEGKRAIFIDIGGGSTEIAIGDQNQYSYLDSLKLGAIRLTTLYVPDGHTGKIPSKMYGNIKKEVKRRIRRSTSEVRSENLEVAVGSSGTIRNLAEIAAKQNGNGAARPLKLTKGQLSKIINMLRGLKLDERRMVPGINPERADIIVPGGAILETIMEEYGIKELVVSDKGLKDGLLVDYIFDEKELDQFLELSVKERSVLQLGRSFDLDEEHANRVRDLALALFDSSKKVGLHDLGKWERMLLRHSAWLHDIGNSISFNDHHIHSQYLIYNSDLLGFDRREITIMANVARFHRKGGPKGKRLKDPTLDDHAKRVIVLLSAMLRLAEVLDRSHERVIYRAEFTGKSGSEMILSLWSDGDCQLEKWGIESNQKILEKAFRRRLLIDFKTGKCT